MAPKMTFPTGPLQQPSSDLADVGASDGRHGLAGMALMVGTLSGGQAVLRPARRGRLGALRFARGGFTLVEVLLAISLMLVFSTVIVFSYSGWLRGSRMDEGVVRFGTMLRMVRAEAANQGRCFRLNFEQVTHAPIIEWEADPLKAPGRFAPFHMRPTELVAVKSCQLTGPSAYLTLSSLMPSSEGQQDWQPITFYPDGSSDSATITLTSATPDDDPRLATIDLNGMTGTVPSARVMTPEEYTQYLDDASQEQDAPPANVSASTDDSSAAGGAGQ